MDTAKRMTLRKTDIETASFIAKYSVGILWAKTLPKNDPSLPIENMQKISEGALRNLTLRADVSRVNTQTLFPIWILSTDLSIMWWKGWYP